MKYYAKETRNEAGEYYRKGDWGVDQDLSAKDNFTDVAPPADSMLEVNPTPCDWDEVTGAWIEGDVPLEKQIDDLKAQVARRDLWLFRFIVAIWSVGVTKGLWSAADVDDAELKAKYAEAKNRLEQLRALGE